MTLSRVVVVSVLLTVVGCAGPNIGPQSVAPTLTLPTVPPSIAVSAEPSLRRTPRGDAFDDLLLGVAGGAHPAGSQLDKMWSSELATTRFKDQLAYAPPVAVEPYFTDELPATSCALGTAVRDWHDNAFYCADDNKIVYDEDWLRDFSSRLGDFAPAAVVAHEWGHHIQQVIGDSQYSIQRELQADCLAAMYLNYRDGSTGFVSDNAELLSSMTSFFSLADQDYTSSKWFRAGEHGSKFQRLMAFTTGSLPVIDGLTWCDGYVAYGQNAFSTLGPYRLVNLPGRETTAADGVVSIAADVRSGIPSSEIQVSWVPELPKADSADDFVSTVLTKMPSGTHLLSVTEFSPLAGSGVLFGFDVQSGPEAPESGIVAVIMPPSGQGGLLVKVSRHQPNPPDFAK